ncbi:MAG: CBS domain-containing protein [Pseudomonadota bacterium]
MLIKDRPEYRQKTDILKFPASETVLSAVQKMSTRNYGSSLIVDDQDGLLGIFTERDLMRRVVNKGLDPASTPLSDVMTGEVKVATADDNLIDWLRMMSNERFRHLPVIDEHGKVVTIMSQGDFVSYTWPDLMGRVAEQTRASLGGRFYPAVIAGAIAIYTLIMMLIFNGA